MLMRVEVAQVDDQPTIGAAMAADAVAAAAYRDLQVGGAGEVDHRRHVCGIGDPDQGRRPVVEIAQRDRAHLVVLGVVACNHPAAQRPSQHLDLIFK